MKFLIITNHSYMLWQFRRELIAQLLQHGEVVISMPFVGHEKDFTAMGCRCIDTPVDRRNINPGKDLALIRTYKKLLQAEAPDAVITYSIKPNIYAGYLCGRMGIPCYVNVQGLGTPFQKRGIADIVSLMYRVAMKRAAVVFFENNDNATLFLRRHIIPAEKVHVLHGAGVNLDFYSHCAYPSEADGIHFLFVGRIMREKGVDELFSAARRLKAFYGDRVTLDIVGFFEDEYSETVSQLEREHIVVFHGFQQDPRPYYAQAHCVVLPSYHEGMSNVLLEGAATGRALITSDIPGCREAVEAGVTGYLCAPQNAESLYHQMNAFMQLTPAQRKQMGDEGRRRMEMSFDKQGVVEETLDRILQCKAAEQTVHA